MIDLRGLARPRLVASDLDGTLLRSDGTASPRTVEAVRAVQDAGVGWVVVTARPPRWMHTLTHVIGDHGVALCSNGGFVYDVEARAITEQHTIDHDLVLTIVQRIVSAVPSATFAVERSDGFARERDYFAGVDPVQMTWDDPADTLIGPVHSLLDVPPAKLMARSADVPPAEFLDTVTEVVDDLAPVAYSGATGLAEISAPGVTKAHILASWCGGHGVDATDVWAFGDMPNDVPMLQWAGSGFAMATGHPDAHEAAGRTCPGNDVDGVAQVLEAMLAS